MELQVCTKLWVLLNKLLCSRTWKSICLYIINMFSLVLQFFIKQFNDFKTGAQLFMIIFLFISIIKNMKKS